MTSVSVARRLHELLGPKKVLHSNADLLCHSYDATPLLSHKPDAVVLPDSEDDFVDAARAVSAITSRRVILSILESLDAIIVNLEDHVNIGLPRDVEALLFIETYCHPEVVRVEAAVIQHACTKSKARTLRVPADAKESEELFTAPKNALTALARVKPAIILEDVTVPRPAIPQLMVAIRGAAQQYGTTMGAFDHGETANCIQPV